MKSWIAAWKAALDRSKFGIEFGISFLAMVVTLSVLTKFLEFVEHRPGALLNDPILNLIQPVNLTWLTFGLIYAGIALSLVALSSDPPRLMLTIQAYTVMVWIRIAMMYLMPLEAAKGLIVLQDPFVQLAGNGVAPTKDLFFSGHTSTIVLLYLTAQQRWLRRLLLSFTALVAVCVVWQHVHYVIDVVVAPFVSYCAYRLAVEADRRLRRTNA